MNIPIYRTKKETKIENLINFTEKKARNEILNNPPKSVAK